MLLTAVALLTAARIACVAAVPAPVDIPPTPDGVESPRSSGLPDIRGQVAPGAPMISAISEVTFPGETLVITGHGLAGARLRVWAEGMVFTIDPLRSAGNRLQGVVPEQVDGRPVPRSTMLVWPERDGKAGAPIRVNGATAWWAWPCRFRLGRDEDLRVFGKNLTLEGVEPVVALIGPNGAAVPLDVQDSNPYHIRTQAPADLVPGEYRLRVHNGTGDVYGWSDAVAVSVVRPEPVLDTVYKVADYLPRGFRPARLDAAPHIQKAIDTASANGGGTVLLPKGVLNLHGPLTIPAGPPITVKGVGMGGWEKEKHRWLDGDGTILVLPANAFRRGLYNAGRMIDVKADGSRIEDASLVVYAAVPQPHVDSPFKVVHLLGKDQTIERCRIYTCQPGEQCIWCEHSGPANLRILDCELYPADGGAVHIVSPGFVPKTDRGESTDFVQIQGCTVYGMFRGGRGTGADAFIAHGGNQLIIENNVVTSLDRAHAWQISRTVLMYSNLQHNSYLANNRSIDVGVHPSAPGVDRNVSEQYLFHVRDKPRGGVLTIASSSGDTLRVDATSLRPGDRARDTRGQTLPVGDDLLGGWLALITRGKGVGQWRKVRSASEDGTLRLARPWRVVPEAGGLVTVQPFFHHHVVYRNYVNTAESDPALFAPNHKSTGVYFFHTSVDNIVAENRLENVASGITFGQGFDTPTAWNLTRDNVMRYIRGNSGGTSDEPMFYCDHLRETYRVDVTPRMWYSIANICRGNRGTGADVIGSIGWKVYRRERPYETPNPEQGQLMPVIENNHFTDARRGFIVTPPANWALFRGNTFEPTERDVATIEELDRERVQETLIFDQYQRAR
mgnify:FL=1